MHCTARIAPHCARTNLALVITLALLFYTPVAFGMKFSITSRNPFNGQSDPGNRYLEMTGEIVPGDYNRLLRFLIKNNYNLADGMIVLSSPGGDVTESLRIARLIASTYTPVSVGPALGKCASACFIIFASAVDRSSVGGLIGVHRPYLSPERMRNLSPEAAEALENRALLAAKKYLEKLQVPSSIIEEMFDNPSTQVHWLSNYELVNELGTRAPWLQEFLIARCGLNRQVESQYFEHPNNTVAFRQLMRVAKCEHQLLLPDGLTHFNEALRPYNVHVEMPQARKEEKPALGSDHAVVYDALDKAIPGWRHINVSDSFRKWLQGTDVFSGKTRQEELMDAFNKNDANRVVEIFGAYQSHSGK